MKIKKGDTVLIISGKDRGKKGKVLHAFPKVEKVSVESVNLLKKHVSPEKQKQQKQGQKTGQIVEFPAPISVSNVKIICPKCNKATRIGKENKERVCKKCNQKI
jgi:large subunit ribosomal protein L24